MTTSMSFSRSFLILALISFSFQSWLCSNNLRCNSKVWWLTFKGEEGETVALFFITDGDGDLVLFGERLIGADTTHAADFSIIVAGLTNDWGLDIDEVVEERQADASAASFSKRATRSAKESSAGSLDDIWIGCTGSDANFFASSLTEHLDVSTGLEGSGDLSVPVLLVVSDTSFSLSILLCSLIFVRICFSFSFFW